MVSQFAGDPNFDRTELITPAVPGADRTQDFNEPVFNADEHFVATWNEATGEVKVYVQGKEVCPTPRRSSSRTSPT